MPIFGSVAFFVPSAAGVAVAFFFADFFDVADRLEGADEGAMTKKGNDEVVQQTAVAKNC